MDDPKLGLWEKADCQTAVRQYSGSQYYQHHPEEVRFVHSVARILDARNARDKKALCSAPSLYILGPVPKGVGVGPKREPAFSLGGVDVAGKVWFGAATMNSSNGFPIPAGADTDALFTYVSENLSSGNLPAIYFDGSANAVVLRFYPKGVDSPDDCEDVPLGGAGINETTLKSVMDKIHERFLMTPTACMVSSKLWNDGPKCYPVERPESAVQGIIEIGLASALGSVRVKREETGVFGRYDLALIEQDPLDSSKITSLAILELKVVKAFTSSGNKVSDKDNWKAILKGVKQAFAYRREHGSRISALCCYDMREAPTLHEKSGRKCKAASNLEVHFWAWPLFSTTEAARDWLASNYLAGTS